MDIFSFPSRCRVWQTLALGTLAGLVLLTTYASQSVELNTETRTRCSHFANFMNDTKAAPANSLREGLDAFVWVFQGDPLGAYIDAKAQASPLEQRRLAILNRIPALQGGTYQGSTAFSPDLGPR